VTGRPLLSRVERFPVVRSTNDVVRDWLAEGTPEVCVAIADEQSAGRGREGRTWQAPPGAALLLSLGFRPSRLEPDLAWRLAATVSLAMAEAADATAGVAPGAIRLKWPNDLAVERDGRTLKLAGVLGETDGLGGPDPRVVVGIGVNVDWAADDFPPQLAATMTSLREIAGRPVERDRLLDAFLDRLESRLAELREDRFPFTAWAARQVTTGRLVELHRPDGRVATVRGVGVEPRSGALLVDEGGAERAIHAGEIRHVRLPVGIGV
jgi:BirA family biotin operon repressor/biotin-[acetyl-CoA-carboxylase] ligase